MTSRYFHFIEKRVVKLNKAYHGIITYEISIFHIIRKIKHRHNPNTNPGRNINRFDGERNPFLKIDINICFKFQS